MKKLLLSITAAVIGGANTVMAAPPAEKPFQPTFRKLRNAVLSPEQVQKISRVQLVYSMTGENGDKGIFLVRAIRPDKVRLDLLSGEDSFTSCRNGKNFWGNDTQGTPYDMNKDEISELLFDIAFLPLPLLSQNVFELPTQLADQEINGKMYHVYQTRPVDHFDKKVTIYLDAKDSTIFKVETEDRHGTTITKFSKYKYFSGVRMATVIGISSPDSYYTLKLQSASLSPDFTEEIFLKTAKPVPYRQLEARFLKPRPVQPAAAVRKVNPAEVARLQKNINDLTVQIETGERLLKNMEQLFMANHADATKLASLRNINRYHSYWNDGLYIRRHRTVRASTNAKKRMKKMDKQNKYILKDYQELQRKVVQMKMQRNDVQAKLDLLLDK